MMVKYHHTELRGTEQKRQHGIKSQPQCLRQRGNNVSPPNLLRASANPNLIERLHNLPHHCSRVIGGHDGPHHRDTGHTGGRQSRDIGHLDVTDSDNRQAARPY